MNQKVHSGFSYENNYNFLASGRPLKNFMSSHFIFCIQIICKIFHLKENTLDVCKKIVLVVTNMKGIIITYRSLKLFSIIFVFRIHLKALVSFKEVRVHSLKGLCTKDSQSFSSTLNCFRHMLKNAMHLNCYTQLFFWVFSMG